MRKILSTLLILATAIAGLIVSGSPAVAVGSGVAAKASAPAVDVPRKLNNINGYRLDGAGCLLAKDGGFDGAPIVMHQCLNFADQQWRLITDPNTGFLVQIRNEKSGLCLVARGRSEAAATVTTCNPNFSDQLWFVETVLKWSRFDNANSGLCLAARTHSIAIQTTCSSFLDQWWSPDDVD
jgi:hypothetical protein